LCKKKKEKKRNKEQEEADETLQDKISNLHKHLCSSLTLDAVTSEMQDNLHHVIQYSLHICISAALAAVFDRPESQHDGVHPLTIQWLRHYFIPGLQRLAY
jgi:hypothetical protein